MQIAKRSLAFLLIIVMTLGDCGGMTVSAAENSPAADMSVSENNTLSEETPTAESEPADDAAALEKPESDGSDAGSLESMDHEMLPETSSGDKAEEEAGPAPDAVSDPALDTKTELPALHIGQIEEGKEFPTPADTEFSYDLPVSFEKTDHIILFANYSIDTAFEKEESPSLVWSILRGEKGTEPGSTSLMEDDDWTAFEIVSDSPCFTLTADTEKESAYYQTAEIVLKDEGNADTEVYDYYIRAAYYPEWEDDEKEVFYSAATIPVLLGKDMDTEQTGNSAAEEISADHPQDEATISENTAYLPDEALQDDASRTGESDAKEALDNELAQEESGDLPAGETVSENSMENQTAELFLASGENSNTRQATADSVGVLTLSAESVTLHPTDQASIRAMIVPDTITEEILWKSSDNSIATVTGTGKTPVKGGYVSTGMITAVRDTEETGSNSRTAQITAVCGTMKATVQVTVVDLGGEDEVCDLSHDIWISGFQKENKNLVYTGQKITQDFRVYHNETLLKEKTDYTLSYKNNINAAGWNTAKAPNVTIKLKGQYSGSVTLYFTIYPADINTAVKENPVKENASDPSVHESVYEQTVTKSKNLKIPAPVMTFGGKKLAVNKDFVCDYSTLPADYKKGDSYRPGEPYSYTVNGTGNFTGSYQMNLVVVDNKNLNFSSASVTLGAKQYEYHGKDLTRTDVAIASLKINKKDLPADLYEYEVYTEGLKNSYVTVYPSAAGRSAGYHGYKKVSLKLKGDRSIKEAEVNDNWKDSIAFSQETLNKNNGLGIFQEITEAKPGLLTFGTSKELLVEGTDYTVKYSNAKKAGTVTATFTGMGRYTGTLKKKYQIVPNTDSSHFTISWKNVWKENGGLIVRYQKGGAVPDFVLKDENSNVLKYKTDYTVKLKDNKALGTMSCEITGKGNYKGYTNTLSLTVIHGDIGLGTISVPDKPYSTKQDAWKSKVSIKDVNGKTLSAGKDYQKEISYEYANAGSGQTPAAGTTVTVTVHGIGLYENSSVTGTYRIFQNNISKLQIVIDNQIYTGKEVTLSSSDIRVYASAADKRDGKEKPDAKSCYEIIEYKNNIKAGTAKVTLRGCNDYGGTKTYSFKILKKTYLKNGIDKITLDQKNLQLSLADKEKKQLVATLTPKDTASEISNPTVIWTTSNSKIATVEAGEIQKAASGNTVTAVGIINAKKAGSVTITAITQDGNKKASCTVKIDIPVLKQANQVIEGKVGDTYQLTFVGYEPQEMNSEGITFESDNPNAVSVNERGLLTMQKIGAATVKVYVGSTENVQQCRVIVDGDVNPDTDEKVLRYKQEAGCNDDTPHINKLLREWEGNPNRYDYMYIPEGVYHINAVPGGNDEYGSYQFGGIVLTSNQTLIMAPGAKLMAIGNSKANTEIIQAFDGHKNITISGGQIIGERDSHTGTSGEWGHGIAIFGCTNVTIRDVEISKCWGDGIYLGFYDGKNLCSNGITIKNCNLHHNRRNNLSITDVSNVMISDCKFDNANGKDPQFGIDIEPNAGRPCKNIRIYNSTFTGNAKASMGIMTKASDIRLENCTLDGQFINWSGSNVVLKNTTVKGGVTGKNAGSVKRE